MSTHSTLCPTREAAEPIYGSRPWWDPGQACDRPTTGKAICSVKFMSTHLTLCPITRGCGTHLREQAVTGSRTSKRRVQQLKKLNVWSHCWAWDCLHVWGGEYFRHPRLQTSCCIALYAPWNCNKSVKVMSTQSTLCPTREAAEPVYREQAVMGSRTRERHVQQLKKLSVWPLLRLRVPSSKLLHCMHPEAATNLWCVFFCFSDVLCSVFVCFFKAVKTARVVQ